MGALREEGVAPKISRNIFSRLAEIREILENKCQRKNPAIRYVVTCFWYTFSFSYNYSFVEVEVKTATKIN